MSTLISRTDKEQAFGFSKAQEHRKHKRGERRHEGGTANLLKFHKKIVGRGGVALWNKAKINEVHKRVQTRLDS